VQTVTAHRKALNPRQERAALDLAAGHSVPQTARRCEVAERTLYYWRQSPAFMARVRELQQAMFGEAVGVLAALAGTAADRLGQLLRSKNQSVALGACRLVLEGGPGLREKHDLAAEVAELAARLEAQQRDHAAASSGPAAYRPGSRPRPA
jgi:hypothetical protein